MAYAQSAPLRTAESIFHRLEAEIMHGSRQPDSLLPSIRDLAAELQVSPATVASAFRKLAQRGLTYVERGVGTKVRKDALLSEALTPHALLDTTDAVDVASGAPDPSLLPDPNRHLKRITVEKALYDVEPILPTLREHGESLMADAAQGRGIHLAISGGALEGVSDVIQARLRPGDRVIVEDPGFAAASSLLRSHGLVLLPVPVDNDGFEVTPFIAALRQGAKAVLYSPRAQNPYGSAMTEERAGELKDAIRAADRNDDPILVIENDHASLITANPYHSLSDSSSTWVTIRSLSKSHGPDLRLAFVIGDELTIDRMRRRQALNRGWISTITQHLAVDLLADGEVQLLGERACHEYARRRTRLVEALGTRGVPARGVSGLNVLIPVDDEGSVATALLTQGWRVRSGQAYRHRAEPFIRVTTAALTDAQLDRLADDVVQVMRGAPPSFR